MALPVNQTLPTQAKNNDGRDSMKVYARGEVPVGCFRMGRATALSKPDGGVRGITFFAAVGVRHRGKQHTRSVEDAMAPFQCAFAVQTTKGRIALNEQHGRGLDTESHMSVVAAEPANDTDPSTLDIAQGLTTAMLVARSTRVSRGTAQAGSEHLFELCLREATAVFLEWNSASMNRSFFASLFHQITDQCGRDMVEECRLTITCKAKKQSSNRCIAGRAET